MVKMRTVTLLGLAILLMMLCISPVSAHKAFVGAFLTGDADDEIQIKAWYEGGVPMANAETTIYTVEDGEKEVYVEGVTDDQGFFTFEPEYKVTKYSIKVEQTGHRAKMDLDLEGGVSTGSTGEELPLFARIIAGFGYLVGLAGIAMIYSARKMRNES
ncbi:hypothetical protein [Methanogenium sp. MK-MG]|uniref:hypothetical protein n=1 Tax=Methanogenium sp. MK-MG TaxID=2599926 RepID=UPI0013ECE787|nr:hypothetical protein [Methanogenium sp. MK-MG]KAF1076391.1 hypothetical protein MKMG_01527 [Methanogenium sp. MK-MG]